MGTTEGILRSTDDGATWVANTDAILAYRYCVTYLGSNRWLTGGSGASGRSKLLESVDDGLIWTDVTSRISDPI